MKQYYIKYLLVAFFTIFTTGCQKENENQKPVTGHLLDFSGCKDEIPANNSILYSSNQSCIKYSFDERLNKLQIIHVNAGFNCCPDGLYCTVSFSNDTIYIEEFQNAAQCRCNCLYDLDIELNEILSKSYYIKIIEPYCENQKKLHFDIDLTKEPDGEFCVTRKNYPWGL